MMLDSDYEQRLVRNRAERERWHVERQRIEPQPCSGKRNVMRHPLYLAILLACFLILTVAALVELATAIAGTPGYAWSIPITLCATVLASTPLFDDWIRTASTQRGLVIGTGLLAGLSVTVVAHISGWYLRYGAGGDGGSVSYLMLTATGFWGLLLTGWLAGEVVGSREGSEGSQ